MSWKIDDPQGAESRKVMYDVVPYTRGIVLDLGAGPTRTFKHWLTVDNRKDTELFGIEMKPDVVADCEHLSDSVQEESVDSIFSSHLLEHIVDYRAALQDWWGCIKQGGYLVLYLPDEDEYPRVGEPGANHDHKWNVNYAKVVEAMEGVGSWDLVEYEKRNKEFEYSLYFVFKKLTSNGGVTNLHSWKNKKPAKTCCVVRYAGGLGDMLQAANIFPELKRQGYFLTVNTTPKGQDILLHDPHVDAWLLQDTDQVENCELQQFWAAISKRYDKFINLCESVEGTLLAMPGRANHMWPDSVRQKYMDRNYLEFTSELAELPYHSEAHFYPTDAEKKAAYHMLAANGGSRAFHVLWTLSGSSIHKFYPHQDEVIARLLLHYPEMHLILSGDESCKILEAGWENEPRITLTSGEISIRDVLTLAQQVDCVVGPETGVLNAVAFEQVGKVVMLSHSSVEMLSKHWVNTVSLAAPVDDFVPICGNRPCRRMHYGREFCPEHAESGAAMCQFSIQPYRVVAAVESHYAAWKQNLEKVA